MNIGTIEYFKASAELSALNRGRKSLFGSSLVSSSLSAGDGDLPPFFGGFFRGFVSSLTSSSFLDLLGVSFEEGFEVATGLLGASAASVAVGCVSFGMFEATKITCPAVGAFCPFPLAFSS